MSFCSTKDIQGFQIHTLANESVRLAVAPELGGRVVSLQDRVSGREWLDGWQPAAKRRLWHPTDPADYVTGPGAGIDECLPTVLPCTVKRKALADHGELWNQPAAMDAALVLAGVLACKWTLRALPLGFERRISLHANAVYFDYQLTNLAAKPTPFQWAWHPLFTWQPGDEMSFGPSINCCQAPDGTVMAWPKPEPGRNLARAEFAAGTDQAAKVFVGPLASGAAEIKSASGARLNLEWPSAWFPYAGVWITRGAWKGLHHWAIEPTNAPVDRLSDVAPNPDDTLCLLRPYELRRWRLVVRFSQV